MAIQSDLDQRNRELIELAAPHLAAGEADALRAELPESHFPLRIQPFSPAVQRQLQRVLHHTPKDERRDFVQFLIYEGSTEILDAVPENLLTIESLAFRQFCDDIDEESRKPFDFYVR